MDRHQMVDRLNNLQHQLRGELDPAKREQLELQISALTEALKQRVKQYNKRRAVERSRGESY